MVQASTDQLRKFVFASLRSRLALDMFLLCLRRDAKFVSVADFVKFFKAKQLDVARVLIDWTRQGLFRPSSTGQYCFCPGAEQVPVLLTLRQVCAQEQGLKGIALWVQMIQKKLVSAPEELPGLAVLPEPAAPAPPPRAQVPAAATTRPAPAPRVAPAAPPRPATAQKSPTPAPAPAPARPAAVSQPRPRTPPPPPPPPLPTTPRPATAAAAPAARSDFVPPDSDGIDPATVKAIRRYVAAIPPLPIVAQQLLKEISSPTSSAKSLASIAIKDPGIVLTLLRMANSAFYGQGEEITDVQRAIVVIGLNNIRHLIMVSGLQNVFKQPKGARGYRFEALWAHALGTSVAARLLVRKSRIMGEAEAGTIGLLHDIGKFAMAVAHPKLTEELIDPFQGPEGMTGIAKEVALFGSTHAIYGMMLLESWKLPREFARIVEYHHHPAYAAQQNLPAEVLRGLALVHVANQLAKLGGLECGDREVEPVPAFCFETLGIAPPLDDLLDERMRHTFEQVKFFVSGGAGARPAAEPGAAAGSGQAGAQRAKRG